MKKILWIVFGIIIIPILQVSCISQPQEGQSPIMSYLLPILLILMVVILIIRGIRKRSVHSPKGKSMNEERKNAIFKFAQEDIGDKELNDNCLGIQYMNLPSDKKVSSGGAIVSTDTHLYFYGQSFNVRGNKRKLVTDSRKKIKIKKIQSFEYKSKKGVGWLIFAILFTVWAIFPWVIMIKAQQVASYLVVSSIFHAILALIFFTVLPVNRRRYFIINTEFERIGLPVKWYEDNDLVNFEKRLKKQRKILKDKK